MSIILDHVSKEFSGGTKALSDVNFRIEAGEFISILGPSGCGKSTLLRLISGLEAPSSGRLNALQSNKAHPFAFVFQDPCLLPWRNVVQNISLPLELAQKSSTEVDRAVREALQLVELQDFEEAYPQSLSGGMRMRCSLARALVTHPDVLLLDEPFAALDEWTRLRLDLELRALWEKKKMTVIFVTHSVSEAIFLSNRVIVLSKRPGRVLHDGHVSLSDNRDSALRLSPEFSREIQKFVKEIEADA